MRLEDITNVLCLSCALMFFYVSSQPSCNPDWFGRQCKYRCRCDIIHCDVNGSCITGYICQGGWFGPACQYADLAYLTENVMVITDGNEGTCNNPNAGDRITITLREHFVFTWLRIHIRDQGRNVAVKETASQDSVLSIQGRGMTQYLDACKAVDGESYQFLDELSCSHTVNTTSWTLTLSRPRSVHRYVIYNRADGFESRLIGLQLESFDSMNRSVFVHKDKTTIAALHYSFLHSPLLVQMVMVTVHNSDKILTLCEVEIYGDSVCDAQHYGRDCEHSCNCLNNEACFVSTGDCPSGCPGGFFGIGCLNICPAGKIGNYCNLTCSDNCLPLQSGNISSCDNNGACLTQCKEGFTGSSCNEKCELETFGINCNESCDPNCVPSGQTDVSSCDNKTGACLKGCQSGFTGALCRDECSPNCAPSGQAGVSPCENTTGACLEGCQSGFTGALCRDDCGVGKCGINCNESCSPKCAASGQADVSSCDNKTGVCLKGCQSGFSGALCRDGAPIAVVASESASVSMELIFGLTGLIAALFVLALCFRRKGQPRQAAEEETLNA